MNEMQVQMKERIQPLLVLVKRVNEYVRKAEDNDYKIKLCCSGPLGFDASTNKVKLIECSKDFAEGDETTMSFNRLKASLRRVTKELVRLKNEDFCVTVKGYSHLTVEYIWVGINKLQK